MKSFSAKLVAMCAAVSLTIALASGVANACAGSIGAAEGSSSIGCVYTDQDADYCYYNCYCFGKASECEEMYAQLGLEAY